MGQAPSPFMDALFRLDVAVGGSEVGTTSRLNLDAAAFTATYNSVTNSVDVGSTGATTSATIGTLTVTGNATIGGTLTQGPKTSYPFSGLTTTGTASTVLATIPVASGKIAYLVVDLKGDDGTNAYLFATNRPAAFSTKGGSYNPSITTAATNQQPLTPTITAAWSAGNFTITANGPQLSIASLSDNGTGGTTVHTGTSTTSASLVGLVVTISGATGTTGINGDQTVTATGNGSFDVAVAYVASGSTGTVVLKVPPVITWAGVVEVIV